MGICKDSDGNPWFWKKIDNDSSAIVEKYSSAFSIDFDFHSNVNERNNDR